MKKWKQIVALLLAVGMILSMAACGGNDTSAASAASAASESTEEAAPAEAPEEEAEAPAEEAAASVEEAEASEVEETAEVTGGVTDSGAEYTSEGYVLPLFDEPVTFTARIGFASNDLMLFGDEGYAMNHAVQAAEEATGVHIEWSVMNSEANMEQFSLSVASGSYEDIIVAANTAYSNTLANGVEEDVFVDIRPYMESCMPFFNAVFHNAADVTKRSIVTEEGYICGLCSISDYNVTQKEGPIIRADYLEKVGMEMPKTYDQLHEVLTAFKSELGLAQPIMLPADLVFTSNSLCAGYDVLGTFSTIMGVIMPWYQVDGVVKFGIVEEGYHEYITMIRQWYEEGLISKDFIELNGNPMSMDYVGTITGGNAGMFFGENELMSMYMMGETTDPDFELAVMNEIVKEEGQITHFIKNESQIAREDATCVTTACSDVEKALTWLDFFFSYEGALLCNIGVEGESYEVVDGKLQYLDSFLNNEEYNDKERNCVFLMASIPCLGVDVPDTFTLEIQKTAEEIWTANDDGAYILPSINLTEDENQDYARMASDISTYIAEHLSKFVVGEEDLATWDSFIDTLYGMGMQDCIDIYQAALDRFYALDVD